MRLYEHEAKKIFQSMGLTIPESFGVIRSSKELDSLTMDFPAMLKSMVLVGGRGKAGGIRKVDDRDKARIAAEEMFNLVLKGYPVEILLAEKAEDDAGACYLGITTNPETYNVIVMASAEGGVDIEQVALDNPESIMKKEIPGNDRELPEETVLEFSRFLSAGLKDESLAPVLGKALSALYATFQAYDCRVAEINPLLITKDGNAVAADAKVVIDDNALYRQGELFEQLGITSARHDVSEPTNDEIRARSAGFPYVDLLPEDIRKDPDKLYVGLVPGGAGYGIFSIDEVANVGERFFNDRVVPVNFMDSGGGPSRERVAEMFHLLMDKEIVDIVITSRFGGISSCDVFIRGLIDCLRARYEKKLRVLPVHGRMVGTDLPSARAYLEKARSETPEALEYMEIVVGNQKIMADVIKDGIAVGFSRREGGTR